jgi:2-amino-4-hydroxy-6-hydroxymethyldihydropteridine diphosphokinase
MILIAFGANQPSALGPLLVTIEAAMASLAQEAGRIMARSRFYRSAPVPVSAQPWYVNAVVSIETRLQPEALLALLHDIETQLGRVRRARNEARAIDLDLLDYNGLIRDHPPILPHPRMHERAFVLLPLAEIAPGWKHPVLGLSAGQLIARLPPGQTAQLMDGPVDGAIGRRGEDR